MTDHNREELRRALIRAEHEWPGNLERRIDAILSVFEQATNVQNGVKSMHNPVEQDHAVQGTDAAITEYDRQKGKN